MGILRDTSYTPINTPGYVAVVQEGLHAELNTDEWAGATKPEIPLSIYSTLYKFVIQN